MVQEDRFEVMDDFRKGKFRYLVATDVVREELILIILHMLLIMIFHLKSYVHRTGRTGRAGNSGKAITFITPYENRFLEEIEEYIGFEIPKAIGPSKEEVMKERI